MAQDAVGEIIIADHFTDAVILGDQFGHMPAQRVSAFARTRRRGKALAQVPKLGFDASREKPGKPSSAGLVLLLEYEALLHG